VLLKLSRIAVDIVEYSVETVSVLEQQYGAHRHSIMGRESSSASASIPFPTLVFAGFGGGVRAGPAVSLTSKGKGDLPKIGRNRSRFLKAHRVKLVSALA
jgi:hypothetical protein